MSHPVRGMAVLPLRDWVLAFTLTLVVLGGFWLRATPSTLIDFDDQFYLGVAYDIRHEGVFTNGYVFSDPNSGPIRPKGMFFAPLYPAFLAVIGSLDAEFGRAMDCTVESHAAHDAGCPRDARLLNAVQFCMAVSVHLLIVYIATVVTASRRVAWLTLASLLATGSTLIGPARYAMTEVPTVFFVVACMAAVVAATNSSHKTRWLAAAGVLLSMAALVRPNFLYLFLACCLAGVVMTIVRREREQAYGMFLAFAVGGAVTLAPWIARNAIVFGIPALTHGYDAHVLVQRVAFNQMTWAQYPQSLVCWLPDGKGTGSLLFGKGTCDVFDWGPGSFYDAGNSTFKEASIAAAGGKANLFAWLLRNEVLGNPVKHALVTVSFALRGAWINHYWGLLGFLCGVFYTARALRRFDTPFLIISIPGWFMLMFNAAVSVNQPRYNLMLVVPFAISIATAADKLISDLNGWRVQRRLARA